MWVARVKESVAGENVRGKTPDFQAGTTSLSETAYQAFLGTWTDMEDFIGSK
tara:strand:- start:301 stop:456 length:156 start_codon:yes stop_codon:yes gene_type:complete